MVAWKAGRLSAAVLDDQGYRNNERCNHDKTADKYGDADPLGDGEKGACG